MRENRRIGFLLIAFIYAAAIAVGVFIFRALPGAFWLRLLLADVAATAFVFVFSVLLKNASVYDPYWSVQPIVILSGFAIHCGLTLPGALLLAVVSIWGVRLTANWAYTFHGLDHQDWRYTMLHERTGALYPVVNFLGIHLFPTLVVYCVTLPAVLVVERGAAWNPLCLFGLLLSLSATVLQGVSDWQLHRFRKAHKTGFIREGLWKRSRHPNYLGEILMWWGVALASIAALKGVWQLLFGAILNTLMFWFISIPMADRHQARKEGFDAYKAETHALRIL
jgi:steroid 5-alpha reductase family enzyme